MIKPTPVAFALFVAGIVTLVPAANAQSGAPAPAQPASGPVDATASSARDPRSIDRSEVQEVVVSAQKRLESSSKVAASLAVMSSEDIKDKGVTSVVNLTDDIANMQVDRAYGGSVELTIRGIASSDNTNKGDPAAALHIDGIYVGRPQAAGASLYDLERIEVLRGPQGTLYGRNANAGAINIISRRPDRQLEGEVDVDAGNYDTRNVLGVVNVPVNSSLALRAAVSSQQHDGYSNTANATNGFTKNQDDADSQSGRLMGMLTFSPDTTLLLGADASQQKGAGSAIFQIVNGQIPRSRTKTAEVQGKVDDHAVGTLAEFNTALGPVGLTYLYGYRSYKQDDILDLGGGGPGLWAYSKQNTSQNSHELRVHSTAPSSLQWVAGLYWFKEDGSYNDFDLHLPNEIGGARIIQYEQGPTLSQSKAVFGQGTYEVMPQTRLILGARGTWDDKSRVGITRLGTDPTAIASDAAAGSWHKGTWKAGVEHDLDAGQMVYATVSTGYKAGGFNDGTAATNPDLYYNPESIIAYEAGIKGRFLDRTLSLGADVFYYDYTNLQKSTAANDSVVTVNAGKADVKGFELEGQAALSAQARLNFGVGLLSAKYTSYTAPNGQDLAGTSLDRAPKASVTLGLSYDWALANDAQITAHVGTKYSSSYIVSDPGTLTLAPQSFTQRAATNSEVTLTYLSADDKWSTQLYGRNLENKYAVGSLLQNVGNYYVSLGDPRTFGLRGTYKF